MIKWQDVEYVNPNKVILKNTETQEIINYEIQDDPNNITKESETPLTAHNLNLAQQEILEASKIYKLTVTSTIEDNSTITIPCNYKVRI